MPNTTADLIDLLRKANEEKAGDPEFARLRDFYFEMLRQGLVLKKEYEIPPIDTIGKTVFSASKTPSAFSAPSSDIP